MADKDNTEEFSLLRAAAVTAPLATGAGFSIRNYMNEPAKQTAGVSGIDKAVTAIHKAQKASGAMSYADHRGLMRHQQAKGIFNASQARLAWEQALQASDPFARKHLPALAHTVAELPDAQMAEAIQYVMERNTSQYTTSVFNKFNRNLAALSKTSVDTTYGSAEGLFKAQGVISSLPENLNAYMENLGINYHTTKFSRAERPDFGFHRVEYFTSGGQEVVFDLPISNKGITMTGLSQQTRRIAPDIGILEKGGITTLSREEYFMREFSETIGTDISSGRLRNQSDINKSVSSLWNDVFGKLTVVTNTETSAAQRRLEEVGKTAIDLRVGSGKKATGGGVYYRQEAYRELSEIETVKAFRQFDGIYAGTSPSALAKARVQRRNLAETSLFPDAVEFSRRPEQGYKEYGLTPESAAKQTGERFDRYRSYEGALAKELEPDLLSPNVRTMYVDTNTHRALLDEVKIGEGEVVARSTFAKQMEFQAEKSTHLVTAHESVLSGDLSKIKRGEVLGWNEAGEAITYEKNMRLTSRTINDTASRGTLATLNYMDVRKMQSNDKFFLDFKALVRVTKDSWFNRLGIRLSNSKLFAQNVDVIATMDDLKKDPAKFAKQVFSSLHEKIGGSVQGLADELNLYAVTSQKTFSQGGFTQHAMTLALEGGVTPSQFGEIFGAVPTMLGSSDAERIANKVLLDTNTSFAGQYIDALKGGVAGGISKISYDKPEELLGVGKQGSIEPRMFEVLQGKALTGINDDLSSDILQRMTLESPEKFAAHEELGKTLQSLTGEITRKSSEPFYDIAKEGYNKEKIQNLINQGESFWMKPGGGISDIYVPPANTVKAMRPFQDDIVGDLASSFHNIARDASMMHTDVSPITSEEMQKRISSFTGEVHKQWAPGGKGSGAYMRGRLPGSRLLKAVSYAHGATEGYSGARDMSTPGALQTVGVPRTQLSEMVTELEQTGKYSSDYIDDLRTRISSKGEDRFIGGIGWRHPTIDEFSVQQFRIEPIDSSAKQIVIPEIHQQIKVGKNTVNLKLGSLVGFAGDKDADTVAISLVTPNTEKQIQRNLLNSESNFAQEYAQHQVRYQMLKAKSAASGALTQSENMIAAARKLATTERYVPKLSLQMSEAKRAIKATGGSADALMALTWLEQTPIAGKHYSGSEAAAGSLETLMRQQIGAFESRDERALEDVFRTVTKNSEVAKSLLEGNVEISQADANQISASLGGTKINRTLKGLDPAAVSREIMQSLKTYDASGGARAAELMTARGSRVRKTEISKMLQAAASSMKRAPGVFSDVSKNAIAVANKFATAGKGMLRHAKPIGFGFAGALAIGTILSSPKSMIGPGASIIPSGKITSLNNRASNKITPEGLMPNRSVGNPTAPRMPSSSAMVSPPRQHNLSVRMRAGSTMNPGRLAQSIGTFTGGNKNVNVNMRDNRSSLDAHSFANRLL